MQLRKEDLRPVREILQFRNQEWIEISEAPDSPVLEGRARPEPQPAPGEPRRAAEPVAATAGDELRVISALHAIGADLGEPVEVSRSADRIIVNGTGLNPERRKQIEALLQPLPKVELHFPAAESR